MQNSASRFEKWIFQSYSVTPEGLGLARIFSALFILFFLIPGNGLSHFEFISGIPGELYAPPPGPLQLLGEYPPLALIQFFHTVLVISLFGMLVGYRTFWMSLAAGLSILVLQGFIFSVGKVNHEIIVGMVPLVMAFSNWGAAFSVDSIRNKNVQKTESWPLTCIALLIGFMMFTAGFPKILGGWLDPSTQAVQGHLFNQYFVRGRDALLAGWFIGIDSFLFWEFFDWATILFEVGFLAAVLSAVWFKRFVCIAVVFHFSTMMMLNIAFLPNFLAYALFLNWNGIYEWNLKQYQKISGKTGVKSRGRTAVVFSTGLLLFFTSAYLLSSTDLYLQDSDLMAHEVIIVSAGVVTVICLFINQIMNRETNST